MCVSVFCIIIHAWVWMWAHHGVGAVACTVHAVKKLTFYGRTTPTATGVRRLRLRAYYDYGYGRTTATGVLRLRLRAY